MDEDKARELGTYLRTMRQELGLSTHRVAELSDIDQATVMRIEQGRFLASGMDHSSSPHALSPRADLSSSCLGQFWKAEVGNFSRVPKASRCCTCCATSTSAASVGCSANWWA